MKNRKAFTIIELVIVIAIIAILAAVLIPVFGNIIKTARTSFDMQLVRNLNTTLAVNQATDGGNKTMKDALDDVFKSGYDVTKITPTNADNEILWDQTCDRFVLRYANGTYEALGKDVDKPIPSGNDIYKLWKIYTDKTKAEASTYSVYWNGGDLESITVSVGFDSGDVAVAAVEYKNEGTAKTDAIIRTNGGGTTLTIDAPLDTVNHYGKAKEINITSVYTDSYHEYGDVLGNINLTSGSVVIESGSSAAAVVIQGDDFANIKANNEANKEVPIIMPMSENAWAADENKSNINPEVNNIIYTKDSNNIDYEVVVRHANGNYSYETSFESLILSMMLMNYPDDTIIFLKDVSLANGMIMIGSNLTLNLNGHTLDLGTPVLSGLTVMDCSLTLMNGTICSDNNIVFLDKYLDPNACAVNINNVLLQGRGVEGNTSINEIVYGAAGTINIDYSFIELAGNSKFVKAFGDEGNLTTYVKIKISNSKIDAQSTDDVFEASHGEITIDNSVVNLNTPLSNGKYMFYITSPRGLHINSGIFTNTSFFTNDASKIVITGGTFDIDPSDYVDSNYKVINNGNGTWTVVANAQ